MAKYEFTRAKLSSGQWDISHPDRVDGGGAQIRIAKEIEAVLPAGVKFTTHGDGADFHVITENDLSAGYQAALASVVFDHKSNAS